MRNVLTRIDRFTYLSEDLKQTPSRTDCRGKLKKTKMKLIKITNRIGNDFWGNIECEHCGHTEKLDSGYYDANYFQNVIPNMQCVSCGKTGLEWREKQEDKIREDLCEIAHYYGGWDQLREVLKELEENDNEAAYDRAMSRY